MTRRLALVIATGLGAGLLPGAPGTWGSLAALPCAWALVWFGGKIALAGAALVAFGLGCWASGVASDGKDPGWIVIDEIAAQWLVLLAAPLDWRAYLAGFLLFRIFDIWKPFPIRRVERAVPGGLGIMLDDVLAAIYALVPLAIGEGALGVRF
ncbi:MAG TPA: phosphatidylglycerophosphatase A [Stellaceae bacterium]|nr:phosphatidylglycerophosphatase A [Stellaceae bacterium]